MCSAGLGTHLHTRFNIDLKILFVAFQSHQVDSPNFISTASF